MNNVAEVGQYSCPKKLEAREETIIKSYRKFIGPNSIPSNKQYWTICAAQYNDEGKLLKGCEYDQLTKSGLIKPEQFYGVEMNENIHVNNVLLKLPCHFINDDFLTSMRVHQQLGIFNPAIVNFDTLLMPSRGVKQFENILWFLSDTETIKDVLVIGNFIVEQRRCQRSPYEIFERMNKTLLSSHFKLKYHDRPYVYAGSGNDDRTWMASVILWKK